MFQIGQSVANTFEEETRLFIFPTFDFNGVASGTFNAGPGVPLTLPTDGEWVCWGVVATLLNGGLASGTNIDYNIYDPVRSKYWYSGGASSDGVGMPVELTAGKCGNIHYFDIPQPLAPGARLVLYASQSSGSTPSSSSPFALALLCSLVPKGLKAKDLSLESFGEAVKNRQGNMYKVKAPFNFSTTNLADQRSLSKQIPLNKDSALLVTGITARYTPNSDKDPRVSENNILVQLSDSRNISRWVQPDPAPLSMIAGNFGSRIWVPPTFFLVMPGMDLVMEVTNRTGAPLTTDLNFVLHCANIEASTLNR